MLGPIISQLAHVEVFTPKLEASLAFYRDVLGLEVSDRKGNSIYLRGWGEFFHHSLQLTEADAPGLGHIGWRTASAEALEVAAQKLAASGAGRGWVDGAVGHGRAYRYVAPGGHLHEIFWEVERYKAPDHLAPIFPIRPQRYIPRGAAVRMIDHVTIASADVKGDAEWYRDTLGHRYMESTVSPMDPNHIVFAMTTTCQRGHDLGIVYDGSGASGRVNHIAYFVDQREELRRSADVLLDQDIAIEFGPGRHGMGEQDYLYIREPGGMRVELNSGGYQNYEPDWQTVHWTPEQGSNVFYKNLSLPHSMFESFPPVDLADKGETLRKKTGLFI